MGNTHFFDVDLPHSLRHFANDDFHSVVRLIRFGHKVFTCRFWCDRFLERKDCRSVPKKPRSKFFQIADEKGYILRSHHNRIILAVGRGGCTIWNNSSWKERALRQRNGRKSGCFGWHRRKTLSTMVHVEMLPFLTRMYTGGTFMTLVRQDS